MPTTELKNRIYRMALPLLAPGPGRCPAITVQGRTPQTLSSYARLLRRHHVLGSAALIASGELEAVLLSSSENPRHSATREILFRVASITKMATSLSILISADRGMLDPDGPVCSFFPGERLPEAAKGVTVRQLLSHTAGLIDPPDLEESLLRRIPFPQVMESALQREPGAEFHYSNLGFGLLGCILEAVWNEPVSRIVEKTVFEPLKMQATLDASGLPAESIMPVARVLPYHAGQEVKVTALGAIPLEKAEPMLHYGHTAGSMYTNIDSLREMISCLREDGRPLLSAKYGQEMKKQHASYGRLSTTLSYGLGLLMIRDDEISSSRILGHQGFAYGCADGAFWEESTGNLVLFLNGGCSEARKGRLGLCNADVLRWALGKELPTWPK